MLDFSLHVYRNILAANCRIRWEDDSETIDAMCINIDNTCLQISLLSKGIVSNKLGLSAPEGFFIPTSVSGVSERTSFKISETSKAELLTNIPTLTMHGKRVFESSFRFQIPNNDVLQLIESKTHEDINTIRTLFLTQNDLSPMNKPQDIKDLLRLLIKPKTLYQMQCTSCSASLGEAIFSNIKDHCSESFSEGWFCHKSDDLQINDSLSSDCLYVDEASFLMSDSILKHKSCNCGSLLVTEGPDPKGFVGVYFDKVIFIVSSTLSACGQEYQKWISVQMLWSLIEKSRTQALFTKMLLQSKSTNSKEDICLLLMIPKEKVSRYHIRGPIPLSSTPIKTQPVYHVLYQVGTHASKDVKTWRHAFDVDFYRVSDIMMNILIDRLKDSLFEDDPVNTDGFTYGYLPAR